MARAAAADDLHGLHVLPGPQRECLAADQAGDAEPVERGDDEDHHAGGGVEGDGQDDDHGDVGDGQARVDQAHERCVDDAAGVPGDGPDDGAEQH
jgi:hypothetical protein